jgi:hypothetical protein
MARITANNIAKACIAAGLPADIELVRGNGYHYFWCEEAACWPQSSVYTAYMTDLTIKQWVDQALYFRDEYMKRK